MQSSKKRMKNYIFLLLAFVLNIVGLTAQNIKIVEDAPDWFFRIPTGKYVGVSYPLKDSDLAMKQATYSAFLSYYLQQDIEGEFKKETKTQGLSGENNSYNRDINRDSLLISLPALNYTVIKTAKNQYGEVFVLLEINSKSSTWFYIDCLYRSSYTTKENVLEQESDFASIFEFKIRDSTNFQIQGNNSQDFQQKEKGNIIVTETTNSFTTSKILDFENKKREDFLSTCKCQYQDNQTTCDYRYNYKKNIQKGLSEISNSYLLRNSLGVSYLDALFTLLSNSLCWTEQEISSSSTLGNTKMVSVYRKRTATPIHGVSLRVRDKENFLSIQL